MPIFEFASQLPGSSAARWVLLALAVSFAASLFNHGLVPSMEPRFAEVVREMIDGGRWLVPIKNGRPYVEYPVFYYWLAIGGELAGLPTTAAIRLPSYLAFFAWLIIAKRWQSYVLPSLPPLHFVVACAAMPLVLFRFSVAQSDSILAAGVVLSMYGYAKHISKDDQSDFPWCLWLGVALAMLAKGPVGAACALPVFFLDRTAAGIILSRKYEPSGITNFLRQVFNCVGSLSWTRGSLVLIAITGPWYVVAGIIEGKEFVDAVLIYQNFARYLTGYSHAQPWWYYFKTVLYDYFPVSLLLPVGVWAAFRQVRQARVRLILIWAVYTFVFFSLSGSKQGKYLLPATPAFVALSFVALGAINERYRIDLWKWLRRWYLGLILLWTSLIIVVVPLCSDRIGGVDGYAPIKLQLENEPGQLIHFQWPRSLTLYELGAPMPFVRSARELYAKISAGDISSGDYVLIGESSLGDDGSSDLSEQLVPYPHPQVFEVVLRTKVAKDVVLLRIRPGARSVPIPDTPVPRSVHWRDDMFDTD